jgi:hypothetical protein
MYGRQNWKAPNNQPRQPLLTIAILLGQQAGKRIYKKNEEGKLYETGMIEILKNNCFMLHFR